jgi:hypothetical protein
MMARGHRLLARRKQTGKRADTFDAISLARFGALEFGRDPEREIQYLD